MFVEIPIEGVKLLPLEIHVDDRGTFTEIYRDMWLDTIIPKPIQWNVIHSKKYALRGMHVHLDHWDYLLVLKGKVLFALYDMRPDSASHTKNYQLTMGEENPAALIIPNGVIHGFYFLEDSMHIYGVTHYWNPATEIGCHWSDPELKIEWPSMLKNPHTSARDAKLPSLEILNAKFLSLWKTARYL